MVKTKFRPQAFYSHIPVIFPVIQERSVGEREVWFGSENRKKKKSKRFNPKHLVKKMASHMQTKKIFFFLVSFCVFFSLILNGNSQVLIPLFWHFGIIGLILLIYFCLDLWYLGFHLSRKYSHILIEYQKIIGYQKDICPRNRRIMSVLLKPNAGTSQIKPIWHPGSNTGVLGN